MDAARILSWVGIFVDPKTPQLYPGTLVQGYEDSKEITHKLSPKADFISRLKLLLCKYIVIKK